MACELSIFCQLRYTSTISPHLSASPLELDTTQIQIIMSLFPEGTSQGWGIWAASSSFRKFIR